MKQSRETIAQSANRPSGEWSDRPRRSTGFPSSAKLVYSNFGGLEMPEQKPDDLAAELVPDPTKLPDLVVLRGYLGKSTRAGFSRLYVDLSFSEFVEVADEDILAKRSLPANQDPLGGTVLWVKRSATLLRATVCFGRGTRGLSEGRDHCKCIAPIQDGTPCRAEASRFRRTAGRAYGPFVLLHVSGAKLRGSSSITIWLLSLAQTTMM